MNRFTLFIMRVTIALLPTLVSISTNTEVKADYLTVFNYGTVDEKNNVRKFDLVIEETNNVPITSPTDNSTDELIYFPAEKCTIYVMHCNAMDTESPNTSITNIIT